MKNKNKLLKALSGTLAAVMTIGCLPSQIEDVSLSRLFSGISVKAENSDFVIDADNNLIQYNGTDEVVAVPDGVVSIGYRAIYNNPNIKKIILPDTLKVIGNGGISYNRNLVDVNIPDGVTKIDDQGLYNNESLTQIYLPDSVKELGDSVLAENYNLTQIRFPEGITALPAYCCLEDKKLETVVIPDAVYTLGLGAFMDCSKLQNIKFGENLYSIDDYCFANCTSLETLYFNEKFFWMKEYVFSNCVKLETIVLPDGFKAFMPNTFYNINGGKVDSIKNIYYEGTKSKWDFNVQCYVNGFPDDMKIYYDYQYLRGCEVEIRNDFTIRMHFGNLAKNVTFNGNEVTLDSYNRFDFPVVPREYDKNIHIEVDGRSYDSSLKKIIENYKATDQYSEKESFKSLIDNMEIFCEAAKQYFTEGGIVAPAEADIDFHQQWNSWGPHYPEGIHFVGGSLNLKNKISVNFYFTLDEGKSFDDYDIKYWNYKDIEHKYVQLTENDFVKNGEYYYYTSDSFVWRRADQRDRITYADALGEVFIDYSAISYCKLVNENPESDPNLRNLCNSLHNFWYVCHNYY